MAYKKRNEEGEQVQSAYQQEVEKKYSDADLVAFDSMMKKYATQRKCPDGSTYAFHDLDAYLVDVHAMSWKEHMGAQYRMVVPIQWESQWNKIDQWKSWRARKGWGLRKRDEQYDKMAVATKVDDALVEYPSV